MQLHSLRLIAIRPGNGFDGEKSFRWSVETASLLERLFFSLFRIFSAGRRIIRMSGSGRYLSVNERGSLWVPAMVAEFTTGTGIVPLLSTKISFMFRHFLLLVFRSFSKFKTTFLINLAGLSSGLACAMLICLWVTDEWQMNKNFRHDARIIHILGQHHQDDGIKTAMQTPGPLADELKAAFPEVEYAVASRPPGSMPKFTISTGQESFKARHMFAGRDYFKVFPFPLADGDPDKVLVASDAILLSESMAMKMFKTTENLIGKPVIWQQEHQFTITGIFKDLPSNFSEQYDYLLSYDVYLKNFNVHWDNHNVQTYVLLRPGADTVQFNAKIKGLLQQKVPESRVTLSSQPHTDTYLFGKYANGVQDGGRIEYVRLFSLIAVFILLIASINFMNLSTARASRRMKEVGVKKAIGAGQASLIFQYLGEAVLLSLISLGVALLAVYFILPFFNTITGKSLSLFTDMRVLFFLLLLTLATGLLAGSYPALYLSGFRPAAVLKGQYTSSLRELWVRKGLVVFQFSISIVLIFAVIVVFLQLQYVQHKNMGYDRENVVYFFKEGKLKENSRQFLERLRELPGVVSAANATGNVTSHWGTTTGVEWPGKSKELNMEFGCQAIDVGLIETMGMQMVKGRSFSADFPTDSTGVIINEVAAAAMGMQDPVGKEINFWGEQRRIVGVVKNFHFRTVHKAVTPWVYYFSPHQAGAVIVRLAPGDMKAAIARIEALFREMNPGSVLELNFIDTDFQTVYQTEMRVGVLSRYFAGLAVIISCLGLLGLAAFTAERRMKEISIRKILGGSSAQIICLMSADFTKLVLVAILIALPVGYFVARSWLDTFAYRIELQWWYFVLAAILALLTAWLTVGSQAVKASRVNPVKHLKD